MPIDPRRVWLMAIAMTEAQNGRRPRRHLGEMSLPPASPKMLPARVRRVWTSDRHAVAVLEYRTGQSAAVTIAFSVDGRILEALLLGWSVDNELGYLARSPHHAHLLFRRDEVLPWQLRRICIDPS